MTEFLQFFSALREQMSAALSRSDILRPLTWLVGMFLVATVSLIAAKSEQWVIVTLIVLLVIIVILYLGAYSYCLIRNPDALRSERYSLQKMAIEHGLLGDSTSGTFKSEETNARAIESSAKQIEHQS
jgi:hypothetical protein